MNVLQFRQTILKNRNLWAISLLIILLGCDRSSSPTPKPSQTILPAPTISPKRDVKAANNYRQVGLEFRQKGDYPKALASLEKSVQLDPQNVSGKVILGWTYHLAKQEAKATQILLDVLQEDSNHIPALNALGIVYLFKGNLSEAVKTHTKAAQLKPDNEIAYYNLSLAYHRLQQFDLAIAQAQKAVTLEPNNPHPWVALAMIDYSQGNPLKAKQDYQKAIALDSRYRQKWFLEHLEEAGFSREQIQMVRKIQN